MLLVLGLKMNSQILEPIEKKWDYISMKKGIPDNMYFKDVNNILEKFCGTWKGTYGSKKYEFRVTKYTSDFLKVKEDKLLIRYIITDLNNNVIENTTYFPDYSPYVISGRYYNNNRYYLNYVAKGGNCAQSGKINIWVNDINMNVLFQHGEKLIDLTECPSPINEYFPTDIVLKLIKQ